VSAPRTLLQKFTHIVTTLTLPLHFIFYLRKLKEVRKITLTMKNVLLVTEHTPSSSIKFVRKKFKRFSGIKFTKFRDPPQTYVVSVTMA